MRGFRSASLPAAAQSLTEAAAKEKEMTVSNSGAGSTGRAVMDVLNKADAEAKRLGDSFRALVTVFHRRDKHRLEIQPVAQHIAAFPQ